MYITQLTGKWTTIAREGEEERNDRDARINDKIVVEWNGRVDGRVRGSSSSDLNLQQPSPIPSGH